MNGKLKILVVFFLFSLSSAQNLGQLLNQLYDNTGGPQWFHKEGWPLNDTTSNPCQASMYGINCTTTVFSGITLEIVSIDLDENNLIGSLPSEILNYPYLYRFSVSRNELSGKIPGIQSYALVWLDLSRNHFEGEIPNNFGSFSPLYHMDLSSNRLTGNLPTSLWSKPIQSVSFSNNQLSGEIPIEIGNAKHLQIFSAFSNGLSGNLPDSFCSLPKLTFFVANGNEFQGEIPKCLFNSSLETLHLEDNQFTGDLSGFKLLRNDSQIHSINLSRNRLSGYIPQEIAYVKNLTVLKLSQNNLTGPIPTGFGSLDRFHTIDLSRNQLEGTIPDDILLGKTMQAVLFSNNQLSGNISGLHVNGSNFYVQQVDFSYNNISGEMNWAVFIVLPNLGVLRVNNNRLTGAGIPTLQDMTMAISIYTPIFKNVALHSEFIPSESVIGFVEGVEIGAPALKYLDVSNNFLTGSIPPLFFRAFPYLKQLKTSNNKMIGSIPGEIIFGFALEELDVSYNSHTGSIPNLSFLPLIRSFVGNDNMFSGNLPEFTGLPLLEVLSLSNNKIQIPTPSFSALFQLPKLSNIDLAYNTILGEIPSIDNRQPAVTHLDLSGCSLMGSIHSSFYNLRLQSLDLSFNNLTGTISSFHSDPIVMDLSSNNFEGGIDFIYTLASIRNLNVSNNRFSGSIPDISGAKSLISLDVSNNRLSGTPPAFFESFQTLRTVDLSRNQLEGTAIVSMGNSELKIFNLSENKISNASIFSIPASAKCSLTGNQLVCPVGSSAWRCGELTENFPCKPADTEKSASMTLIVRGNSESFNYGRFMSSLSASLNVSEARFKLDSVSSSSFSSRKRSESTQLDFIVSPPPQKSYEGSAEQVVEDTVNLFRSNSESVEGFTVLAAYPEIQRKSASLSKGGIAGIVVGCLVFLLLVGGIVGFLLWRRKMKKIREEVELESIDTLDTIILNNVQIQDVIGAGNFGEVYRGNWNGTRVALKSALGDTGSEKWRQEIGLLKGLNHPNIVRMLGIHKAEGKIFVVLEYAANGSLDAFLHKKSNAQKMSDNNLLEMCFDLTRAMTYLQAKKILHRDLAARNLLVDASYHVKVSDFGLSKINETYERESTPIPVRWSAPETIEKGSSSTASDVWSFAVCVWEIFTFCNIPYPNLTNGQVLAELKTGYRLPKPERCPEEMYFLMLKCWKMDPEDRPNFNQIHYQMIINHPEVLSAESKGEYSAKDNYDMLGGNNDYHTGNDGKQEVTAATYEN